MFSFGKIMQNSEAYNFRSVKNVNCRMIGSKYSEMYDNLISDMDLHYFDKFKTPGRQFMLIVAHSQYLMLGVTDIEVGKVYAAQVSSDWHRVKVFIYSGQKLNCPR